MESKVKLGEPKTQLRNMLSHGMRPQLETYSGFQMTPILESKLQDKFGQEFSLILKKQLSAKVRKDLKEANQS